MGKKKHRKKRPQERTGRMQQPIVEVQKTITPGEETPVDQSNHMKEGIDIKHESRRAEQCPKNPPKSETNSRDLGWLWAGGAGACLVLLIICLIGFIRPEFRHSNYYIYEDPSMLKKLLSSNLSTADSTTIARAVQDKIARRKDAIEDLLEQRMIVSSEEFASNITGYYNALIAVLSAILIILNLFGFFSWRSNANTSMEQKQRELDDVVNKIDDRLETNLEEILRKNQVVRERLQSYLRELLDQRETLTDDEWDKLHLLLAKYEKQEVLKAIESDNNDENDGEIES